MRAGPTSSRTSSRTCRSRRPPAWAPFRAPRRSSSGQDRLREKELFRSLGIPTARFGTIDDTGLPAIVKTRRLGYDGKGQRRVDSVERLVDDELAEELVAFDRELSIVGVRGQQGETRFWPVGENVHRDGILRVTQRPGRGCPPT